MSSARPRRSGLKYRTFTDAERSTWERMYVKGRLSTTQIARETRVPQSTVALHIKRRGLTRDSVEGQQILYADADRETLSATCVRMFREGVAIEEIALRIKQKPEPGRRSDVEIVQDHLRAAGLLDQRPKRGRR